MKNGIKKTIHLLSISSMLLLGSCEKFLTREPIDIPVMETYWQTEADGEAFVNGIYSEFRDALGGLSHFEWGDFPTKIWQSGEWGQYIFDGKFEYYGTDYNSNWSRFYRPISVANNCIDNIERIPLDSYSAATEQDALVRQKKYLGQAHFLRALCYFYMARIWGEVPLVTDYVKDVSEIVRDIPMATEEELLNFCLEDLDKAIEYLDWKPTFDKRASKANRGSAYALRAHVLMWKNRLNNPTIDPNNYTLAIAAIDSIENSNEYRLVDTNNYISMFSQGGSEESLFEVVYDKSKNEVLDRNGFTSRFLGYPYITDFKDRNPIFCFNTQYIELMNKFPEDWRRNNLFYGWGGKQEAIYTIKYQSIHYTNVDKSEWETDDKIIIFRLADIYLLKAEAYNRLGQDENAKIYLQKVRSRVGIERPITTSGDDLLYEIEDERERELLLEGHRLYDWVRTGAYARKGVYTYDRWMSNGHLWPVNYSLIGKSKYIRQTPYWADKMVN